MVMQARHDSDRRAATLVVAASDSPAWIKRCADYVCDGVADQAEIQAAIDMLRTSITDEVFNSGVLNVWVELANIKIHPGVTVTSMDGLTTYVENTDYRMDYPGGRIVCLSTGAMAAATNFLIDYSYGGGSVMLSEGIYLFGAKLNLYSYITLEGQGASSVIKTTANLGGEGIVTSPGTAGAHRIQVIVKNLRVTSTATAGVESGILLDYTDYFTVEGVWVDHVMYDGILPRHCTDGKITGCDVSYTADDGINPYESNSITISGNVVHHTGNDGIHCSGSTSIGHTITGNILDTCGGDGITILGGTKHTITGNSIMHCRGENGAIYLYDDVTQTSIVGNTIYDARKGIYINGAAGACSKIAIVGNQINYVRTIGASVAEHAIYIRLSSYCTISANYIEDVQRDGILVDTGSDYCTITGNVVLGCSQAGVNTYHGIYVGTCTGCTITGNVVIDSASTVLYCISVSGNTVILGNSIKPRAGKAPILASMGSLTRQNQPDLFMDVLAVSAIHCGSWAGTGAEQVITVGITQPDVPRNLTVTATNVGPPSGNVVIAGVDAKGNTVSETFAIIAGGTRTGNVAFARITSITIPATVTAVDTIDAGIGSKLGLSNVIYATGDVYKIKKNNADAVVAGAQVNTTYDTYDMAVIGLAGGDDFTIWYMSNLNILS